MTDYRNRPPVDAPRDLAASPRDLVAAAAIAVAGLVVLYLFAVAVGCAA